MSSHIFSSLVLRELIKKIEQIGEGIRFSDEEWAETMATKYHEAIQEQPVVDLTEKEYTQATVYLAWYKASGIDVADRATQFIRGKHAAEIRQVLKARHDDRMVLSEHDSGEDIQYSLPSNDGTPTCFEEWFAVTQVWRLTLAMKEISFQDAATGTSDGFLNPLPNPWEEKLNECMQITDASAIVPAPRGYGLPLTRRDINSVLPTSDHNTYLSGLLNGAIINRWFRILVSHRNQRKPDSTLAIHPYSLDLATATPQEVAAKAILVNADLDMILFPTVIKEQDHCILLVAFPKKHMVLIYDSLGPNSTKVLQKKRPWVKEGRPELGKVPWEVQWAECPQQGEEDACGVFMFINALFLCSEKDPIDGYSQQDVLFLRRYIAAVICMGELPPSIF